MDYTFVVPAYNEEKLIGGTLDRLNGIISSGSNSLEGEIVVADNNSDDATAEIARRLGAKVVFEKINCIARARNAGAKAAQGRYLFFVDADTEISQELFDASISLLLDGHVCGGGAKVRFSGNIKSKFADFSIWAWEALTKIVPMAAGSYIFCTREAWEKTGGFDERYYASEEIHFSRELRRYGRKNNQEFILVDLPVYSSPRKLEWYSTWELASKMLFLALFPFALRHKRFCGVWYDRKNSDFPLHPQ